MMLFWHPTGPLVKYREGLLEVHNLNPEVRTEWRMSLQEMYDLGWRCIAAALVAKAYPNLRHPEFKAQPRDEGGE